MKKKSQGILEAIRWIDDNRLRKEFEEMYKLSPEEFFEDDDTEEMVQHVRDDLSYLIGKE